MGQQLDDDEIARRFTYHTPSGDQPERYVTIREKAKALALIIVASTPESGEQTLAIRALEEAVMWANAAIARREGVT